MNQQKPAKSERLVGMQRLLGGVVAFVAVCLALVLALAHSQSRPSKKAASELRVTGSVVNWDGKSGKLIWTGSVVNHGADAVPAPWVLVTLYDPAGDGVDTGEATTAVKSIRGGGSLAYRAIFDCRGNNMRAVTRLEAPNSRPLGM